MMQIKDMTTAEWRKAWTEIAVAFEMEPDKRTQIQDETTICGLCYAIDPNGSMDLRMGDFANRSHNAHWFPPKYLWNDRDRRQMAWRRQHDLLRSTFAAMFAAMTPKEFLEICEAPR